MKTLCPAVLGLEAVVLLLAIPVLLSLTSVGTAGAWAMVALAAVAVLAAGLFRRDPGTAVPLGWGVQAAALLSGLLVPAMVVVAVMFGALWWAAVHFGGKVDRLEARRAEGPRGMA